MSLYTTRSNTGKANGASTLLKVRLGGNLSYLACGHHSYKFIVGKATELRIPEVFGWLNITPNPLKIKKIFLTFSFDDTAISEEDITVTVVC